MSEGMGNKYVGQRGLQILIDKINTISSNVTSLNASVTGVMIFKGTVGNVYEDENDPTSTVLLEGTFTTFNDITDKEVGYTYRVIQAGLPYTDINGNSAETRIGQTFIWTRKDTNTTGWVVFDDETRGTVTGVTRGIGLQDKGTTINDFGTINVSLKNDGGVVETVDGLAVELRDKGGLRWTSNGNRQGIEILTNEDKGLKKTGNGEIVTASATEADIDAKTNVYKPIAPSNLDYAVAKASPVFVEAASKANIGSGDTLAVILGKIKKYFSDLNNLQNVAFSGDYNDLTNTPTLHQVATTGSYNDLANKPSLFSGNYNDLSNKPTIPTVPNTQQIVTNINNSNYKIDADNVDITIPTTLPASDVSSWAKASTKPNYTASEVGLGNVTNESKATMFNSPTFTGTPKSTTPAAGDNSTNIATTAFVHQAVQGMVAPDVIDGGTF